MTKAKKNPVVEKLNKKIQALEFEIIKYQRDRIRMDEKINSLQIEVNTLDGSLFRCETSSQIKSQEKDEMIRQLSIIIGHLINKDSVLYDKEVEFKKFCQKGAFPDPEQDFLKLSNLSMPK